MSQHSGMINENKSQKFTKSADNLNINYINLQYHYCPKIK